MKATDEAIISMMKNETSREKGLRLLMDTYQSRLYWHIRRFLVDHEASQDVLQETFIKAYQNFHQFIVTVPGHCVKFQGIFTTIC